MAIVCSSCDHEPAVDASAGAACASCGERLIVVAADDLIGTVIDGRFEVLAQLGQGGMGVVYRARQLSIGREVALKMLDRRIERDVAAVKRFFREAKIASTLQHPNTVPIIDFGQTADGRLYLAMELVRGRTLQQELVETGPFPVKRVAAIGTQLCNALEVAHGMTIVHRDLKLDNVMLERDHVRILDFGLARSLADPSTQMTATGLISGTPRYMAPEVVLGGAAPDPSQDMYALGVILAELVLGKPLWSAPTLETLFSKKLAVEQTVLDVPAALRPLVSSLISEDPEARPSAATARAALDRILGGSNPGLALELDREPATSTVALEPTPAALEPTGELSLDAFARLDLVAIDELDAPRARPVAAAPTIIAAPLAEAHFAAPPEPAASVELEIDPAYVAARSLKRTAHPVVAVAAPVTGVVTRPPPRRDPARTNRIVMLLIILGVGIGAYWLYTHRRAPTSATQRAPRAACRHRARRRDRPRRAWGS